MIYHGLLGLALIGPPLIGILVPVVSFVRLRRESGFRPLVIVAALLVWIGLSIALARLFIAAGFGYAWGWAHADGPPQAGEGAALFGILGGGLILLSACGFVLHRIVLRTRRAG